MPPGGTLNRGLAPMKYGEKLNRQERIDFLMSEFIKCRLPITGIISEQPVEQWLTIVEGKRFMPELVTLDGKRLGQDSNIPPTGGKDWLSGLDLYTEFLTQVKPDLGPQTVILHEYSIQGKIFDEKTQNILAVKILDNSKEGSIEVWVNPIRFCNYYSLVAIIGGINHDKQ